MNKLLLTTLFISLFSVNANAKDYKKPKAHECDGFKALASMTMAVRQDGGGLSEMIEQTKKAPTKKERKVFKEMAIQSHRVPVASDEISKEVIIEEFAHMYYSECLKLM